MSELGNKRRVYLVTGTDTLDYAWLSGEQTNSFNRTAEAVEHSDKSALWAQFLSGKKGATAEVTVYTDDTDEQQQAVLLALESGTKIKVFIGTLSVPADDEEDPEPTVGDFFEAIITAINDTNENGSVAARSLSLTATGAVTHYPAIS
jgi:hypothetical protein